MHVQLVYRTSLSGEKQQVKAGRTDCGDRCIRRARRFPRDHPGVQPGVDERGIRTVRPMRMAPHVIDYARMAVTTATRPGAAGRENEDWVGTSASGGVVVVLDGVSSPGGSPCVHGPAWYVRRLGPALLAAAADRDVPLRTALQRAIEQVNALHSDCDLASPGTPAAAVGLARLEPDVVSHLVLADVTVATADREGRVRTVSDDRVESALDPQLRDAALDLPFGSTEQRAALRAMSVDQLARRNTAGGYWVAAADPYAAREALVDENPRDQLRELALLTDGAAALVDVYNAASWPEVFDMLRVDGPGAVIDRVRDVEASDPDGYRWPRFKPSDDAAIAHVRIDPTCAPRQRRTGDAADRAERPDRHSA